MKAGDVVVMEFPFTDLSGSKPRPAVIVAAAGGSDYVACQITSNSAADPNAVALSSVSFTAGGLKVTSYARPGKLFTAHRTLVSKIVGRLINTVRDEIKTAVVDVIRNG